MLTQDKIVARLDCECSAIPHQQRTGWKLLCRPAGWKRASLHMVETVGQRVDMRPGPNLARRSPWLKFFESMIHVLFPFTSTAHLPQPPFVAQPFFDHFFFDRVATISGSYNRNSSIKYLIPRVISRFPVLRVASQPKIPEWQVTYLDASSDNDSALLDIYCRNNLVGVFFLEFSLCPVLGGIDLSSVGCSSRQLSARWREG